MEHGVGVERDKEMSRIQGRETSLFNDIANTALAEQMESRLKELERNIAVARQFIKLADECYSQVRHEWDLLQQERSAKPTAASASSMVYERPKTSESAPRFESFKETKSKRKGHALDEKKEDPLRSLDEAETEEKSAGNAQELSTEKAIDSKKESKNSVTSKNSFLKPRHKKR